MLMEGRIMVTDTDYPVRLIRQAESPAIPHRFEQNVLATHFC